MPGGVGGRGTAAVAFFGSGNGNVFPGGGKGLPKPGGCIWRPLPSPRQPAVRTPQRLSRKPEVPLGIVTASTNSLQVSPCVKLTAQSAIQQSMTEAGTSSNNQ